MAMTTQLPDCFQLEGERYDVLGSTGAEPFSPQALGLEPVPTSTGRWRGYLCHYALDGDKLVLDRLEIGLRLPAQGGGQVAPAINGVSPGESDPYVGYIYEQVSLGLRYSGKMTLARDRIVGMPGSLVVPMAWDYRRVVELHFEEGCLVGRRDISDLMAASREQGIGSPLGSLDPGLSGEHQP